MKGPDPQLLSAAFDSLEFAVTCVDADGSILFVNGQAARNLSTTPDGAVGRSLYEFFPTLAAATRERIRQAVERKQTQHFESVVTLPDGSERYFDSAYCPAFDGAGQLSSVQIVARDVTAERVTARSARDAGKFWSVASDDLSMTAERIKAILESAPMVITVHDPDMTIRYINRVAEGVDIEALIGSSPVHWITEEGRARATAAFARVRETRAGAEYRAQSLQGRTWLARLAPLVHDGAVAQILSCTIDITEQTRLHEQLSHRQKIESLGTMARGIAHDFNNLLAVIMGDAGLVRRRLGKGIDPTPSLDAIDVAARRAAELCEQMLVYAGRERAVSEPGDLNAVIEGMARLTRAAVNAKIDISYELCEALPLTRVGGTQLGQVVLNLINNAADAIGEEHGTIGIATDTAVVEGGGNYLPHAPAPGRYVRLRVVDSGPGISTDAVAVMFDPFYSTKSKGHGLGLSVVLGIVSSHGAAVGVQSDRGQGTTMTVLFPMHEGPVAGAGAGADAAGWERGDGTVLVVDDEIAVRTMAALVLEEAGYAVLEAGDGDEALAMLAAHPTIRAVLLDVTMPRRDGYSTLLEMRKSRPSLPVVLSSGQPTRLDEPDAHVDLLPKPYSPGELAKVLAAAIRRPT